MLGRVASPVESLQNSMLPILDDIGILLRRELEGLRREIALFPDDSVLWATPAGVANSAGNLALHLEGSNRVDVLGNDFAGNGWAIRLLGNSENDHLQRNRFSANSFDLTTNTASTTATLDANEWDQYRGYDLDHDGYGDVPFRPMRLFAVLVQDNEPALILLRSLFIDLLDVAEKVLPVLTPQGLVDHHPVVRKAAS